MKKYLIYSDKAYGVGCFVLQKNNFYPSLDILDLKKDLQNQIQIKLPRRKKIFLKSPLIQHIS